MSSPPPHPMMRKEERGAECASSIADIGMGDARSQLMLFALRSEGRRLYRRALRAAQKAFPKSSDGNVHVDAQRAGLMDEIRADARRRRDAHEERMGAWTQFTPGNGRLQKEDGKARVSRLSSSAPSLPAVRSADSLGRERFELAEAKKRVEELEMMLGFARS